MISPNVCRISNFGNIKYSKSRLKTYKIYKKKRMIYQLAATLLFNQTNQYEAKVQQTKIVVVKFIYSEKATKFKKNLPLTFAVKSKGKISQKFCGLLRIYEL